MKLAKSPITSIAHSLPLCEELTRLRRPLITFHENCSYYENFSYEILILQNLLIFTKI